MKSIIIVESPGKVDTIQKYVGDKFLVCASNGQIVELAKGGRFGIGVNPFKDFKTQYCLMPDKMHFIDRIICQAENIDRIIIATDPDTEGHGIAWHISQYLKHLGKPIVRAEFSEITQSGIEAGLSGISGLDENKFKAQETRRILDRIVGFMVSPYLINFYGKKLSAGRVQSVTTRMVVEREQEINTFVPQEYWNLAVKLKKPEGEPFFVKYRSKLKDGKTATELKIRLLSPSVEESVFEVVDIVRKPKKELPPPPLNTSRMQQLMASKHGVEGEQTMAAAQILYELGFVTYIRTDSVRTSITALDAVREWLIAQHFTIPNAPYIFKNKEAAQNAHECIRPTHLDNTPNKIQLSPEVQQLYKLIWTSFVASQMTPAIYDTLSVRINHKVADASFQLSGKALTAPGYLALLNQKIANNDLLPDFVKGETLKLYDANSVLLEQKFTQPASRYTYASLLKELEENGIGRPSTFADIIGKITARQYVDKRDSAYHGTELGSEITTRLLRYFDFMKFDYTADLEKQMDEIALGKADQLVVLRNFYDAFVTKLGEAHISDGGITCPSCRAPIYKRLNKNGEPYTSCSLYPLCKNIVADKKFV